MVFARVSVSRLAVVAAVLSHPSLGFAQSPPAADPSSDQGAVPSGISGAVVRPAEPAKDAPKKPVIVLPELTHFEHAEYPAEAEKSGLQDRKSTRLNSSH